MSRPCKRCGKTECGSFYMDSSTGQPTGCTPLPSSGDDAATWDRLVEQAIMRVNTKPWQTTRQSMDTLARDAYAAGRAAAFKECEAIARQRFGMLPDNGVVAAIAARAGGTK